MNDHRRLPLPGIKRRFAGLFLVFAMSFGFVAQPAAAGEGIWCPGSSYSGVHTWGYSSYWTSHGHVVNGWVTFRSGVYTGVSHPAPPSSSDVADTYNTWDVTNASSEGAHCWISA